MADAVPILQMDQATTTTPYNLATPSCLYQALEPSTGFRSHLCAHQWGQTPRLLVRCPTARGQPTGQDGSRLASRGEASEVLKQAGADPAAPGGRGAAVH